MHSRTHTHTSSNWQNWYNTYVCKMRCFECACAHALCHCVCVCTSMYVCICITYGKVCCLCMCVYVSHRRVRGYMSVRAYLFVCLGGVCISLYVCAVRCACMYSIVHSLLRIHVCVSICMCVCVCLRLCLFWGNNIRVRDIVLVISYRVRSVIHLQYIQSYTTRKTVKI